MLASESIILSKTMDLEYLLENRKIKNQFYSQVRVVTRFITDQTMNITSQGLENIPKSPYVLALHHEMGADGWVIRTQLKEKIHFWLQYENHFNRGWKSLLECLEEIPIKTAGTNEEMQLSYFQAVKLSNFWLSQKDSIAVFTDGPKKDILIDNDLIPLESRPNLAAAVGASYNPIKKEYYSIVPVSFWTPKNYRKQFSKWGKTRTLKNFSVLFKRSISPNKIPYRIAYGSALNPQDYINKHEMKEELRKIQIQLHKSINSD